MLKVFYAYFVVIIPPPAHSTTRSDITFCDKQGSVASPSTHALHMSARSNTALISFYSIYTFS